MFFAVFLLLFTLFGKTHDLMPFPFRFQLIYEYSLIKDKLFSYEKLESKARELLDDTIREHSISNEHCVRMFFTLIGLFRIKFWLQLTERDFSAVQKLCNDFNEPDLIFKVRFDLLIFNFHARLFSMDWSILIL